MIWFGGWFLSHVKQTMLKGDIETVSVRLSVCPKWKSSYNHNFSPILNKFTQHVYTYENLFYL